MTNQRFDMRPVPALLAQALLKEEEEQVLKAASPERRAMLLAAMRMRRDLERYTESDHFNGRSN